MVVENDDEEEAKASTSEKVGAGHDGCPSSLVPVSMPTMARRQRGKEWSEEEKLDALRLYIENLGGDPSLLDGWSCEGWERQSGRQVGYIDWYVARSRPSTHDPRARAPPKVKHLAHAASPT